MRLEKLAPGRALVEEDLARQYQVSRTPIREALRRLVQDGLIERQGGSFAVTKLSAEQVAEIYPIISMLEGLAARLAASRTSRDVMRELRELHQQMRELARQGDTTGFVTANQRFHDLLIRTAANTPLEREIGRFRTITSHFRRIVLSLPQRQAESIEEHEALIAALRDADGERAEQAMRRHVQSAHELLTTTLRAAEFMKVGASQTNKEGSRRGERARQRPGSKTRQRAGSGSRESGEETRSRVEQSGGKR
jgi:DNA-binding GntR family transcriptional regulator